MTRSFDGLPSTVAFPRCPEMAPRERGKYCRRPAERNRDNTISSHRAVQFHSCSRFCGQLQSSPQASPQTIPIFPQKHDFQRYLPARLCHRPRHHWWRPGRLDIVNRALEPQNQAHDLRECDALRRDRSWHIDRQECHCCFDVDRSAHH